MGKSGITPINSYVLDPSIEEFNKEELKEAGVVIDYDQQTYPKKIRLHQDKKPSPKKYRHVRWLFLGILVLFLYIIMQLGEYLINDRNNDEIYITSSIVENVRMNHLGFVDL